MQRMSDFLGRGTEGTTFVPLWNTVISTTYAVLNGAQCSTTGLVPNWYNPNDSDPSKGDTSCGGSSTRSDEFGAEASRTMHRLALDYLWFADETSSSNYGAFQFNNRAANQVISKYVSGTTWNNLDTGCLVGAVFGGWTDNAFIFGPTFASLIVPVSPANSTQQTVLDSAGTKLKSTSITDYYAGSWVVLSTMAVNGDFGKVSALVRSTTSTFPQVPVSPSTPSSPSPTTASPAPTPTTGSTPPTSTSCSYGAGTNDYWVEVSVFMSPPTSIYFLFHLPL